MTDQLKQLRTYRRENFALIENGLENSIRRFHFQVNDIFTSDITNICSNI